MSSSLHSPTSEQPQFQAESMLRRLHSRLRRRKSSSERGRQRQPSPLVGGSTTTSSATPILGRRLARTASSSLVTPHSVRSTKLTKVAQGDIELGSDADPIVAVYGRTYVGQLALLFGSDEHLELQLPGSEQPVLNTPRSRRWDDRALRAFRDSFRRSRSATHGRPPSNIKTHQQQRVLVPMPDPVSASYIPSLLYNSLGTTGRPSVKWQQPTLPSHRDTEQEWKEDAYQAGFLNTPDFLTELRKLSVEIKDHYSSVEAGERDPYGGYILPPLPPDGKQYANDGGGRQQRRRRQQWAGSAEASAQYYSREQLCPRIPGVPNLLGEHLRDRGGNDYPFLHTSLQHIAPDHDHDHDHYDYGSGFENNLRAQWLTPRRMKEGSLSTRHLSATEEAAMEAYGFLRGCVQETKYVTAVFESTKGGLAPILADVVEELAHWLGPKSRLLAAACEIHWSVPELFRSRVAEIRLKDAQHQALRDNNRRVLALYADRECRRRLPSAFIESKTEECCVKDKTLDAFQGVYRRYYPEFLPLLDPETVNSHRAYWTLEKLGSRVDMDGIEEEYPLRPEPFKFLRHMPSEVQLRRKSIVALNMAVLRMEGDESDYDNGER